MDANFRKTQKLPLNASSAVRRRGKMARDLIHHPLTHAAKTRAKVNSESYKVMSTATNQTATEAPAPANPATVSFYTPAEFATIIRFHPESIRRAIRSGRIASVRFSRKLLIPAAEAARIFAQGL